MKENYDPWLIKIEDYPQEGSFKDQLKFLIGFGILAPSGHNSQPWQFRISSNQIDVFVDSNRSLTRSDPEKRQLLISIGCAIENILIAADFYGNKVEIEYFPNSDDKIPIVALKFFDRNFKMGDNRLISSILKRATNRKPFENKPIEPNILTLLESLNTESTKINIISNPKIKNKLADIVNKAEIEIMGRNYFREELSEYVKSNFTKSKLGMPGFTQGIPDLVSFFASKLIRKINFAKVNRKKNDKLLKEHTPALIIVSTKGDDNQAKIEAGRFFERVWIIAESNNLKLSPLAAPTQMDNYSEDVRRVINTNFKPQIISRIGYCKKGVRHTPRLSVKEVIIK